MTPQRRAAEALTKLLETGDKADRCYAARALGVFGDESAVVALTTRLRDADIDVCVDAAEALREIGSPTATPFLIKSIENESSGEICTAVVTALARLGGETASNALLKVAAERPKGLDVVAGWDPWWDVQLEAVKALGNAKEDRAVDILLGIMDNEEHQDIESEALKALAQIGGAGTSALIERLQKGAPRTRRRAAKALEGTRTKESAHALGQALTDAEADVRAAALNALAEQGAAHYLPAVLLLLRDTNETVRSAAIRSASRLVSKATASEGVQAHLLSLLNDPSGQVRTSSFNTLAGEIEREALSPESVTAITASLDDPDPTVGAAACNLLGRNGDASIIPRLSSILSDDRRHPMLRRQAALALGQIGLINNDAIQALTEMVGDREQSVRLAALTVLMDLATSGCYGQKEVTDRSDPLGIVIAALEGKIQIGAPEEEPDNAEAVEEIEAPREDGAEGTTALAAEASNVVTLDTQVRKQDDLEDRLELALPSAPPRVAYAEQATARSTLAAIAMGNVEAVLNPCGEEDEPYIIDDEALHYLDVAERHKRETERMLVKRSLDVAADARRLAARVLAESDSEEAVMALTEIMRNESNEELAVEAILSLGGIASRAPSIPGLMNSLGPLIAQLGIGGQDRRLACARTLGRLRNRAAIAPLLSALEDETKDVGIEAIRAITALIMEGSDPGKEDHMVLEEVPATTIAERFIGCLEDKSNGVRLAAAQGLTRLLGLDELRGFTAEAVDKMIAAAFLEGGQQTRPMGQAIRTTNLTVGSERLLALLEQAEGSAVRRFIIEMLEELFKPQPGRETA